MFSAGTGGGTAMARDHVTVRGRTSWGGRLGRSLTGVLVGLVLVAGTVAGLFWNEGRAVTTARSLAEGRGLVVDVAVEPVDPANRGRLVHVAGPLKLAGPLADPLFPVSADAIRLVRRVEMYQWRETSRSETRKTLGGGEETVTTYDYDRVWHDGRIDSAGFRETAGHDNPALAAESLTLRAQTAALGAFAVDTGVLDQVGTEQPVAIAPDRAAAVAAALGTARKVTVAAGAVRVGDDPDRPVVGDLRITFAAVPPGPVSVVGRQEGSALVPYQTASGDRLLLAEDGFVPADGMFANAEAANTLITWAIRVAGLVLMWIGFALVLGPLSVVFDVVPALGSLVGFGTGLIALLLTALVGPLAIAVAWFWYRPLVSLAVIAVAALAVWLLLRRARRRAPGTVPA